MSIRTIFGLLVAQNLSKCRVFSLSYWVFPWVFSFFHLEFFSKCPNWKPDLIFSPNYLPMIECWWSCRLQCQLLSMCKENSYSRQKPKWSNLTKFLSKQYGLLRLNSSSQNIVRRLETLWQVVTTFHKNRDMFHNIKINLPFGFAFMTKPPYN